MLLSEFTFYSLQLYLCTLDNSSVYVRILFIQSTVNAWCTWMYLRTLTLPRSGDP